MPFFSTCQCFISPHFTPFLIIACVEHVQRRTACSTTDSSLTSVPKRRVSKPNNNKNRTRDWMRQIQSSGWGRQKTKKKGIGRTRLSSPTAHSIRQKEKDIVLDRSGTSFTADQCAVACSSHIDVYDSRGFVRSASPAVLTISNRWTRRATDPIREKTERNQGRGRRKERIDTFGKLDSVVDDYGLSTPFSFPRWFFSAGL